MSPVVEFRINSLITLRLQESETFIYINGKKFRQCKYLFFLEPYKTIDQDINSIDEASESFKKDMEGEISLKDVGITPKEVFWGHCSNIQAWVENDYDTRLLHRNLAFPLLQRLAKCGDVKGKQKFLEEVLRRFKSYHFPTMLYLFENGYLDLIKEKDENFPQIFKYLLGKKIMKAKKEIRLCLKKNIDFFSHLIKYMSIRSYHDSLDDIFFILLNNLLEETPTLFKPALKKIIYKGDLKSFFTVVEYDLIYILFPDEFFEILLKSKMITIFCNLNSEKDEDWIFFDKKFVGYFKNIKKKKNKDYIADLLIKEPYDSEVLRLLLILQWFEPLRKCQIDRIIKKTSSKKFLDFISRTLEFYSKCDLETQKMIDYRIEKFSERLRFRY